MWHNLLKIMLIALLLVSCKEEPLPGEVWQDSFSQSLATNWQVSDGWTNGDPFAVGWRKDHATLNQGKLVLTLDDQCSSAQACSGKAYAGGEVQTNVLTSYGTFSARMKAAQGDGVVNGFFLYAGDSGTANHQEIDIEILGNNTQQVQFNYYTNGVGGHEKVINLGFDAALGYHNYSIIRLLDRIQWWVDGVMRYEVVSTGLPSGEMYIFFNLWAATGVDDWTGSFSGTGLPLYMKVDWVSYHAHAM